MQLSHNFRNQTLHIQNDCLMHSYYNSILKVWNPYVRYDVGPIELISLHFNTCPLWTLLTACRPQIWLRPWRYVHARGWLMIFGSIPFQTARGLIPGWMTTLQSQTQYQSPDMKPRHHPQPCVSFLDNCHQTMHSSHLQPSTFISQMAEIFSYFTTNFEIS